LPEPVSDVFKKIEKVYPSLVSASMHYYCIITYRKAKLVYSNKMSTYVIIIVLVTNSGITGFVFVGLS
jgi:hypothetical protein